MTSSFKDRNNKGLRSLYTIVSSEYHDNFHGQNKIDLGSDGKYKNCRKK